MSAEARYAVSMTHKDGTVQLPIPSEQITVAIGDDLVSGRPLITGTAVQLDMGTVTTPGLGYFRNLDTVNTITLSRDEAGTQIISVIPPEQIVLNWVDPAGDIWAESDGTGSAQLYYCLYEGA
jgi:hypothetical protein